MRDNQALVRLPAMTPLGVYGRPLFQGLSYHDTPEGPPAPPEMRYLDVSAKPGEKHTYSILTINSAGVPSEPSAAGCHSFARIRKGVRIMRSGLKLFFAAAIVWTSSNATSADVYVPFEGEKITWHGFDRYDFIMDDATGAITPFKAPASEVTSFGVDVSSEGWQAPRHRSRPQEGGARQSVVMASLLLEPPASNRSRATETRFSHRLCGARPRRTGQGVGPVVQVPDGKARPGEESGLHRDEQGRSQ